MNRLRVTLLIGSPYFDGVFAARRSMANLASVVRASVCGARLDRLAAARQDCGRRFARMSPV
jgi:hypothetical protein